MLDLFKLGPALAHNTVQQPGIHGAGVRGTHAEGAPKAAITAGFVGLEHIPKGMIFNIGLLSIIDAAGMPPISMRFIGSTVSGVGATPNEHLIKAPPTTIILQPYISSNSTNIKTRLICIYSTSTKSN